MARESWNERVYALVRRIPPGRVANYGAVARFLDNPRGARAVGWALNRLSDDSDVPWHRVVNAQGQISPRAAGSSAQHQRKRLTAEGVEFDGSAVTPQYFIRHPAELQPD